MMRFSIFAVIIFAVSCSAISVDENVVSQSNTPVQASELALLMRSIHKDAKDWRKTILEGNIPGPETNIYLEMVSSKPTKPEVKGAPFEAMALNYQRVLDSLFVSQSPEVAKLNYNVVVNSCIGCHQAYCPGPISTIKKLRLPE